MEPNEKEINKKKINEIYSSVEYQSDFGMAKIIFYSFKESLIYENKYLKIFYQRFLKKFYLSI